jgi:integration host factor subunit beta
MPYLELNLTAAVTGAGPFIRGTALVTKKEIVRQLCDKANKEKLLKGTLTQLATKEIVQWTFDAIIDTLVTEGRIELRNFGVFEVKQRKPRKARNPRTGDKVDVAAKNVVTFQPGKEMEERVRQFAKPIEPKRKPRRGAKADADEDTTPMTAEPSRNGMDAKGTGAAEPVGAGTPASE